MLSSPFVADSGGGGDCWTCMVNEVVKTINPRHDREGEWKRAGA